MTRHLLKTAGSESLYSIDHQGGSYDQNFLPAMTATANRIQRAMAMLWSAHDGDLGVVEIAACGPAAIPALRDFVFDRDPSGLYQARCRAVEALAALGAADVLRDLLGIPLDRPDPVERTGDEAVVNAAARALIGSRDEALFPILLALSRHRHLSGVIEALGSFRNKAAIPRLIDALVEDGSRPTAEAALLTSGKDALPNLLEAAGRVGASVSELRRGRSVLRLLLSIGVSRSAWPRLRQLMFDRDEEIAVVANEIALVSGAARDRRRAVVVLIALLSRTDWRLEMEIEDTLVDRYRVGADIVAGALRHDMDDKTRRALQRVSVRIVDKRARY